MAISFGGTGQYLKRTTNLPPATAWTLAGWFRVRSVRAAQFQYFIDLDDGNNYAVIGYNANGDWDIGTSGGAATNPTGPALNTWTYIACTLAGAGAGNFKVYHATPAASAFTMATSAGASFTPTAMYVGNDFVDEYLGGIDIANVMVYSAVLTEYELWRQMRSARPVRWQNLNLWSPLRTLADVGDYSGNGNHWSVGGTLAGVDGPPLAWQRAWFVPFVVAGAVGVTGNGAATLGGLTATAAGSVSVNGAGAASVGGIDAAGSASLGSLPGVSAAGAALVGAVVAAGAGSVGVNGAGSATLRVTTAGAASVGVSGTGTAVLGAVQATGKAYRLVGATVGGVVTASGRYFAVAGTPLMLAGFHTWADVSDTGSSYPPAAFDWPAYLSALVSAGANYTKLWMMESARDWGDASPLYFAPIPWARTGPGNAADGRLKFDLTKYDNTYFERMRERAILAGNAGVYVCVQLFQGWHIESKGLAYNPWLYHPFNAANNINGVNGDANADGKGLETRLTTSTAIYNLQKSYVDQVIQAVGDLDNVIYEISNEDHNDSWDWQVALMGYIRTVEAGRAKQHLVGLTVCWPTTNNAQLAASAADWVSYADTDTTPDATTSGPVSAYDTDHNPNLFTTGRGWVWKALTRGHGGLWLMDEWAGETYGHDTRADSAWNAQRANLGYARAYAARLDLANATAQGALSSTGYALAKTSGRYQLLAYQPTSGAFTVNLSALAGTFTLEWLRPATGATQAGSNVSGGAVRTLTPPWAGEDVVALLELAGYSATGGATVGGITAAGAASAAINAAGQAVAGALVAAAAGSVDVRGSGAAAVGGVAALGAGAVAVGGAGQAVVGAVVAAAAGSVAIGATGGAVVGAVSAAASASVAVAGTGAAQVGGIVAAGVAVVAVGAAGAATVGAVTASGYGSVGAVVIAGSGGVVLGAIAAAGVGSVAVQGSGGASIAMTAAGGGSVAVNAAGAATVAAAVAAGVASVAVNGAGQATVGAIVAAGYAGAGTVASGGALLGDLVAAGVGSVAVGGAGLATVGGHVAAAAASVAVNAAGAAQVGVLVAAGAASVQVTGSGSAMVGAIAASGTGALSALPEIHGYGAATVGGIITVGTAVVAWVAVMGRVSGPGGRGAVSGPGTRARV